MGKVRVVIPFTMRTIPRAILLLLALCSMTLLFLSRCSIEMEPIPTKTGSNKGYYLQLLGDQDKAHRKEIDQLRDQLLIMEKQLKQNTIKASRAVKNAEEDTDENEDIPSTNCPKNQHAESILQYVRQKVEESEITHGVPLKTEYDVIGFDRFTMNRVYLAHPGLGKRVVERPIGYRKKDLNEVLLYTLELLNKNRPQERRYSAEHFVEGLYRTEPSMGTHYNLYFRDIDKPVALSYRKLTLTRPFAPIQVVNNINFNTQQDLVHVILPLSGRIDTFRQFMDYFVRVCILGDKRIFLTIVYFGTDGLKDVQSSVNSIKKKYTYQSIKLIPLNETFSRGRGLQVGANSWKKGDILMFLCDVDVIFTMDFLERCRLNAEKGVRVYYPIVFSLYNPKVVYSLQEQSIPSTDKQLVISKSTGFWRDFGYGMTCQYRSDFLRIGGFEEKITGWGMEDVLLYKKYVKSNYFVVRAPDPGVFHMWHNKYCDPKLSSDQYRGCIQSKALNEASHEHLGVLAFKDEIDIHKSLKKKEKLR